MYQVYGMKLIRRDKLEGKGNGMLNLYHNNQQIKRSNRIYHLLIDFIVAIFLLRK
jgi:hypothetical protein